MTGEGTEALDRPAGRRRKVGIVVTGLLLFLTIVWLYFDRDAQPTYPPAPVSFRLFIADHLRAEAALPLNDTRGEQ